VFKWFRRKREKNGPEACSVTYQLTWITDDLAVGYAPMSYADLDCIRSQGIDAIVNLCGEFCDLHEIQEKTGFEVYYLPIPDESAPDMEEMERALAWLDEAIYLGKKVLVHCRHGIGRTGTFVTSYLLRRGLGLKLASKKLKHTRANPTNYCQWKLLKEYGKKSGVLQIREPSLESKNVVDLTAYFADYEALALSVDEKVEGARTVFKDFQDCGRQADPCCFEYFELQLLEVIFLSRILNRKLKSKEREKIIHQAVEVGREIRAISAALQEKKVDLCRGKRKLMERYGKKRILCPLNSGFGCIVYEQRPLRCRHYGISADRIDSNRINSILFGISQKVFFEFSGMLPQDPTLTFSLADAVSGKYVQEYFSYLLSLLDSPKC
jgi:protein-tyrosine phosphatase